MLSDVWLNDFLRGQKSAYLVALLRRHDLFATVRLIQLKFQLKAFARRELIKNIVGLLQEFFIFVQ